MLHKMRTIFGRAQRRFESSPIQVDIVGEINGPQSVLSSVIRYVRRRRRTLMITLTIKKFIGFNRTKDSRLYKFFQKDISIFESCKIITEFDLIMIALPPTTLMHAMGMPILGEWYNTVSNMLHHV